MSYEHPQYLIQEYHGIRPRFYDPSEFSWIQEVESNWNQIREEALEYLEQRKIKSLGSPNVAGDNWKSVYLNNFTWIRHGNWRAFPKTRAILDKVPNVTFTVLSVLEPHSEIKPHYGDTNTIIRCHLGLIIPGGYPELGLRVGGEGRVWEEGKVLMFSECYLHSAWNYTDQQRMVLVFDIMREEYLPKQNIICSKVLAAETQVFLEVYIPLYCKLPRFMKRSVYFLFTLLWMMFLPIQRKLSFIP